MIQLMLLVGNRLSLVQQQGEAHGLVTVRLQVQVVQDQVPDQVALKLLRVQVRSLGLLAVIYWRVRLQT